VVTYWLYTYIPWFFPFAAVALLAPGVPLRQLVAREHEVPKAPPADETYADREVVVPGPTF
jgi:hypothetical protein